MRPRFELIVITDGAPALVQRLSQLEPALDERVAILLRDKQAGRQQLIDEGGALRSLTRAHGATLLISQHVEVAVACDADGVQLPEAALPGADGSTASIEAARAQLGAGRVVGVSRHDLAGLHAAARAGADYATLSPIFPSPDKGAPLGVAAFAAAARTTSLPLFALGGVTLAQIPALRSAGAAGVAVIREVLAALDPVLALRALLHALHAARSS